MVDTKVVIVSSVAFFLYIVLLIYEVRLYGQSGILTILKKLFISLSLVSGIALWIFLGDTPLTNKIELIGIHEAIFWALSFGYILCLFGVPLSSVRIQALLTIADAGKKGISIDELRKRYSTKHLMEIRLHRLESSGEIVRVGESYKIRSEWSYFMLHNYLLLVLLRLYRPFERTRK